MLCHFVSYCHHLGRASRSGGCRLSPFSCCSQSLPLCTFKRKKPRRLGRNAAAEGWGARERERERVVVMFLCVLVLWEVARFHHRVNMYTNTRRSDPHRKAAGEGLHPHAAGEGRVLLSPVWHSCDSIMLRRRGRGKSSADRKGDARSGDRSA